MTNYYRYHIAHYIPTENKLITDINIPVVSEVPSPTITNTLVGSSIWPPIFGVPIVTPNYINFEVQV